MRVREHVARAAEYRRRIREAGDEVSDRELHDLWHDARNEIDAVRLYGDLALAAFFAEAKPKQREAKRLQFTTAVAEGEAIRYLPWLEEQRDATPALAPFHWEIEFPEVFDRENPGFDAFIGNPPFAGKNAAAAGNVTGYPDWLKSLHDESHGVTTHPCYQRHARRERSEWPPTGCSPGSPWTADSLRFGNRLRRTCGCGSILRLSA